MRQKLGITDFLSRLAKDVDESLADDLAFTLRVGHSLELLEKKRGGIFILQSHLEVIGKQLSDCMLFAVTQQAVVNEDTSQLIANGTMNEGSCHTRVNPTAEP